LATSLRLVERLKAAKTFGYGPLRDLRIALRLFMGERRREKIDSILAPSGLDRYSDEE
jgi:hypothetical protein